MPIANDGTSPPSSKQAERNISSKHSAAYAYGNNRPTFTDPFMQVKKQINPSAVSIKNRLAQVDALSW